MSASPELIEVYLQSPAAHVLAILKFWPLVWFFITALRKDFYFAFRKQKSQKHNEMVVRCVL